MEFECNMSEKKPETKETKKKTEMSDTENESMAIRDRMASSLFLEFLPHYWDIADDLQAYIKLKVGYNLILRLRFISMMVTDLCY